MTVLRPVVIGNLTAAGHARQAKGGKILFYLNFPSLTAYSVTMEKDKDFDWIAVDHKALTKINLPTQVLLIKGCVVNE